MTAPQEDLRYYFAKVRPIYCELFAMAHAILGNYELAAYAVQKAIVEGWQRSRRFAGKLGFREGLRSGVKRIAYSEAMLRRSDRPELTWDGFAPDIIDGVEDEPFIQMAAQEFGDVRRVLALHYGCGFSAASIAKLVDMSAAQIRQTLERFEKKLKRKLKGSQRSRVEAYCTQVVRREFASDTRGLPDPGTVYRTFQVEAAQYTEPHRKLHAIIRFGSIVLLMLLAAGTFWITAVLIQPAVLVRDEPVPSVESLQTEEAPANMWGVLSDDAE